jgi:hypothetical protein
VRRNAAIEQERRIKENELQTDLLVQTKQRELHERELEGEIALEKQRAALTDQKTENERKEADAKAYALKAVLAPVQGLDWRLLMMLNAHPTDARSPKNRRAQYFPGLAPDLTVAHALLRAAFTLV